jgi:hypothetical protein
MSLDYASAPVHLRSKPQPWTRFVIDYNPCFLLSAVMMLVGCRILNSALNSRVGDTSGAMWLVLTINVYELALLASAMLIKQLMGMRRDVGILLVVAMLFGCDITFVVGDLATANPMAGMMLSAMLAMFAVPKAWVTLDLLESPKRLRIIAMVAAMAAAITLLPAVLKLIAFPNGGRLPLPALYTAWWIAGLLPVIGGAVLNFHSRRRLPILAAVYLGGPYAALLLHLLACTWVFKQEYPLACYSPVLFGVAVLVGMMRHRFERMIVVQAEWLLMLVGLLLVINANWKLTGSDFISPLRLTAIAALLVNAHGLYATRHWLFAATILFLVGSVVVNATYRALASAARGAGRFIDNTADALTPRTNMAWGILTVAGSFVLLIGGLAISLWKRPARET